MSDRAQFLQNRLGNVANLSGTVTNSTEVPAWNSQSGTDWVCLSPGGVCEKRGQIPQFLK